MMKNMRELLDTFTESEWKKAKKEMTKRIPSMKIENVYGSFSNLS